MVEGSRANGKGLDRWRNQAFVALKTPRVPHVALKTPRVPHASKITNREAASAVVIRGWASPY
jgi:hypothetical protein